MTRLRRDIDDMDAFLDPAVAADHRARRAEDRAASEENLRREAEADAAAKLRVSESQMRANDRSIEREYESAKIEPVRRSDGKLVSLALLLRLGWSINEFGGKRVLAPPGQEQKPEPREELGR